MSRQLTRPRVHRYGDGGEWIAEMIDDDGEVWGSAIANTRSDAIALARKSQPPKAQIREKKGWIQNHPVATGAMIGACAGGAIAYFGRDEDGGFIDNAITVGTGIAVGGILVGAAVLILREMTKNE